MIKTKSKFYGTLITYITAHNFELMCLNCQFYNANDKYFYGAR